METRANYIIVGLFVIGFSTILVCLLLWFLAGQQREYNKYLVYMSESVTGLTKEAPVRFNGVDVGYVADIALNPKNQQQVKLLLNVTVGTPVNQGTIATLMTQGITGVTYVGLKAKTPKAKPLIVLPGNHYPIIPSEPSLLTQLDTVIRELTSNMKQISTAFQTLLNEENQKAIHDILANSAKFTQTLAGNSDEINKSFKEITAVLKSGQNLTQTLSQQAVPGTVQTLNNLSRVLKDIEQLSSALKENPSILVRGQAPMAPGPGE
ncbi:MAG: hypothetical protein K0Q74_370 [Gammaproteobacteria bacterium]|nr:hypothetical protein [Gammaproteobacteria bacterium]